MPFSRDHRILLATALLALGAPVGASLWVGARTRTLADHLGAAGEVPARIGAIDADLTGTVRLSDVRLGDSLFAADAVEASVSLDSLLSGQLGADEIRVAAPRVALEVDRTGDSDLARVVRRLAHHGGGGGGGATRVHRIVVSSGTLTAKIAGIGELAADGVELVPDDQGVRVLTGAVRVRGSAGRIAGELVLERSAADVALPRVKFGRVLAVAGTGKVVVDGTSTIAVHDVAVGRLTPGGPLELRGEFDDAGAPRAVSLTLAPDTLEVVVEGDRIPLAPFAQLAPRGIDVADARATGTLALRRDGTSVTARIAGTLDQLRLDHPTLGPEPIAITAGVRGTLTVTPEAVALDGGALELGAAHWAASGWLRRGSPASAQLDLRVDPAPCADLLASLPAAIRGPLDGMAMTGTFGGHAHFALDLAAPPGEGADVALDLANACEVTAEPPAADVTQLATASDQVFADGSHAKIGKGLPGWTELRRVPGRVTGAFTSAEDARFFDHHGFDLHQIVRSLEINLRDHKLTRGGSTISQQLIKNAFLTQRRSLDRKVQEAILTWRLEQRLDKKAILERYLNLIELGPHVFGLGAAAHYWFGITPRDLTVRQAAFLAALTSEPTSMSRRVRHAGDLDSESAARVDVVLRAMRKNGVIGKDEYDVAKDAPLHFAASALRREN
jgi:hypothetical protein